MKAAELKTLQGLNVEDRGTGAENLPQIELQTDEHAYALHFIPVPIRVKTTPNTTIYFEATAGGRFKAVSEHTTGDGLSLAKVVTDKDGIAEIAWFTPGDSVGYNEVFISTPKASNFKIVSIETKQLLPKPIVDILSVNKRVPHKLPNKKPQLPKHN